MKPLLALAVLIAFVIFPNDISLHLLAAQSNAVTSGTLAPIQQRFVDYAKDLNTLLARTDPQEVETLHSLGNVAHETANKISSIETLLLIYEGLKCGDDRTMALPIIKQESLFNAKELELSIDEVNVELSQTQLPAAVAERAMRMKDDLRNAKATLDSLQSSLK